MHLGKSGRSLDRTEDRDPCQSEQKLIKKLMDGCCHHENNDAIYNKV